MKTQPLDKQFIVTCRDCGENYDQRFQPFCETCGGITDVEYNLETAKLIDSPNPYVRFKDFIPVQQSSLLPQNTTFTPTVHAQRLGDLLGMDHLYLKNETVLPTGTTKDRMAATALAYLKECGVTHFCTSSTGNSSTAYSRVLRNFEGFKMFLFTASDFYDRVQYADHPNIIHYVLKDATFAEAFEYGGKFAELNGFVSEKGFFNLGRREGLKLTLMEAMDQINRPVDWYVQAISSAMGVFGAYKGAKQLKEFGHIDRIPHMLCIQQESCNPMARAWSENAETIKQHHIIKKPQGIAKAILRGDPTKAYPFIRDIVKKTNGSIEYVSEKEIREAKEIVENLEGISPCFSASAAVAGLIKSTQNGIVPLDDTVMINLTGSDRAQTSENQPKGDIRWLTRTEKGWLPDKPNSDIGFKHSGHIE